MNLAPRLGKEAREVLQPEAVLQRKASTRPPGERPVLALEHHDGGRCHGRAGRGRGGGGPGARIACLRAFHAQAVLGRVEQAREAGQRELAGEGARL